MPPCYSHAGLRVSLCLFLKWDQICLKAISSSRSGSCFLPGKSPGSAQSPSGHPPVRGHPARLPRGIAFSLPSEQHLVLTPGQCLPSCPHLHGLPPALATPPPVASTGSHQQYTWGNIFVTRTSFGKTSVTVPRKVDSAYYHKLLVSLNFPLNCSPYMKRDLSPNVILPMQPL